MASGSTGGRDGHEVSRAADDPRGAARRVVVVQRQARRTLAVGGAFAVASVVASVVPTRTGSWLALHLLLLGSVLAAISAAAPLFAVTWAAGRPPSDRLAAWQRGLLAAGATVVAIGHDRDWPTVCVALGGLAVLTALGLLAWILVGAVRSGVQHRFDRALRAYLAAVMAGVGGCALGIAMVVSPGAAAFDRLRAAHLTLNLLGLVGLVIAGSIPFFVATQARVKMHPRVAGVLPGGLLALLIAGLVVATSGFLTGRPGVAAAGLLVYAAGVLGQGLLLPRIRAKQLRWAGPRLLQLVAGLLWWAGTVVVIAAEARDGRAFGSRALLGLVVGGDAQILAAAVAYLAPVLRGGGHERLAAGFRTTRSWPGLVAANTAAVALVLGRGGPAAVALGVWIVDGAVRLAVLAVPVRRKEVHQSVGS